jgi:hypothetical protein
VITHDTFRLATRIGLVTFLVLWLVAGCAGPQQKEEKKSEAGGVTKVSADRMYAGRVVGTDAFVGIAMREGQNELIAYVCDGPPEGPEEALAIDAWFQGPIQDNQVDITAQNGEHLQAQITPEAVVGTFMPPSGQTHAFEAEQLPLEGDAGLYWGPEPEEDGLQARAGRIVLANGEEKGTSYPPYNKSRTIGAG